MERRVKTKEVSHLSKELIESEILLLRSLLFPDTPDSDFVPMPKKGLILVRPNLLDRERGVVSLSLESGEARDIEIRVHGIRRRVYLYPISEDWLVVYL